MSRTITRSTACTDVFAAEYLNFRCSKYYSILDPLSSSKPGLQKSNRCLSKRNKCKQQWDVSYATNAQRALRYKEVCEKLGLPIEFTLINEFKHNKQKRTNEGKQNDGKNPSTSCISNGAPKVSKTHSSNQKIIQFCMST